MYKIVIGLPGNNFSDIFLKCWTELVVKLIKEPNIQFHVAFGYSSYVTFARMQTLGLDVLRGIDQRPFNGQDFDYFISLDSDIFFTYEQLIELINNLEQYPVVSGYYMMSDAQHTCVVKDWDTQYFAEHGTFKFLKPSEIIEASKMTQFIPISYSGMGFFGCRREVFEKLQYPYFWRPLEVIQGPDGKTITDTCSEDVAFCKNIQDAGFQIILNTKLRVGHEKKLVI